MKKLFMLSFICIASTAISFAQLKVIPSGKVGIGITSPSTMLHMKDASPFITLENSTPKIWQMGINSNDFFIVDAAVGTRFCIKNSTGRVGIGTTTPKSLLEVAGLIIFDNDLYNTFLGFQSGNSNTTGANNTFSGYRSGYTNIASGNTFYGSQCGVSTTSGESNTFSGFQAGNTNTTAGYDAFYGYKAGYSNTTGQNNTFTGYKAGYSNTSAHYNTFYGTLSGYSNNTGSENTIVGYRAGYGNTTGYKNTFSGYNAGIGNITGNYNTLLGYEANVASSGLTNATAIGNGAVVTNSNYIRIGNANVTQISGYVGWTNLSDGRFKVNVQENVKGLEFINKLRPVTYQMNTQSLDAFIMQNMPQATDSSGNVIQANSSDYSTSMSVVHSGFIAQEVEQAENESGFTSSIVSLPANNNDPYALCYAEFVVPLVKAVQELNATVVQQGLEIQALKTRLIECCKTVTPSAIDGK